MLKISKMYCKYVINTISNSINKLRTNYESYKELDEKLYESYLKLEEILDTENF